MTSMLPKLHAIILVAHKENRTFYVKRSTQMENYPGVWSLPSIQFLPRELPDHNDIWRVQAFVDKFLTQRLGPNRVRVEKFLTMGDSDTNPIGRHVHLYLYEAQLVGTPELNPTFYTDMRWLTPEEFEHLSAGQTCGLCVRLWGDYAWLHGLSDRPFSLQQ